jgi:hypothetical protein
MGYAKLMCNEVAAADIMIVCSTFVELTKALVHPR